MSDTVHTYCSDFGMVRIEGEVLAETLAKHDGCGHGEHTMPHGISPGFTAECPARAEVCNGPGCSPRCLACETEEALNHFLECVFSAGGMVTSISGSGTHVRRTRPEPMNIPDYTPEVLQVLEPNE